MGFGGVVTIAAAGDVALGGLIDASGGDFDGGEVDVAAGGDLSLAATAVLSADGHQRVDNFAGAKITADSRTGTNTVRYRDASKAPPRRPSARRRPLCRGRAATA